MKGITRREIGKAFPRTFLFIILSSFLIPQRTSGENVMQLSSSTFRDGAEIPIRCVMEAIGGKNRSPQLSWRGIPAGTGSFALSIIDRHPIASNWIHWLVIDIPSQTTSLEEGASLKKMPRSSRELENSFGDIGYGGPQPPEGTGDHHYVVTLYALSVERLGLDEDTSLSAFNRAIKGKVLGSASITGRYQR